MRGVGDVAAEDDPQLAGVARALQFPATNIGTVHRLQTIGCRQRERDVGDGSLPHRVLEAGADTDAGVGQRDRLHRVDMHDRRRGPLGLFGLPGDHQIAPLVDGDFDRLHIGHGDPPEDCR